MLPDYSYSDPAVLAFVVLPVALVAALMGGVVLAWRRSGASRFAAGLAAAETALGATAWMSITWFVAESGRFRTTQPSLAMLVLLVFSIGVRLAFSGVGHRLAAYTPLWALVGVQGFRFPLELAMHAMFEQGIMPEQMSYSGRNFDIVTGISAVIVAFLVATGRAGRRLVMVWNVLGLALLLNIVGIAIVSLPTVAVFGPDRVNVWITYPPFVWLPAVMVLAALAGHLIIFRALTRDGARAPQGKIEGVSR